MVFSSGTFLFFFLPVLLFFYYNPIFKGRRYRNYVLFIGSVLFYAWGEPVFVFLLLFSVAVNWGIGLLIAAADRKGKQRGKGWMITGVVWNLLLLVVFYSFGREQGRKGKNLLEFVSGVAFDRYLAWRELDLCFMGTRIFCTAGY